MRNILLAATAMAALVGTVGTASAQVNQGAAGFQWAPGSSVPGPTNEPGTVKAYFRGRLWVDAGLVNDSGSNVGANKSQPIFIGEFARLYTSFEGTTANGLKYGAFVEMRQENLGSSPNNGPSGNTGGGVVFFRRQTGYVGGNWGAIRFGSTDGPLGLFLTGTFENFDNGGSWNGDLPDFTQSNTNITWTFPENSGDYGGAKIVYLSPQFAGFDFGVSYEPNSSGTGENNTSVVGANSIGLTSLGGAWNPGQLARERNTIQAAGRYQGNVGPVALTVAVEGFTAGTISNGGMTGLTTSGAAQYKFKSPYAIDFGTTVAFGGFAIGGNIWTGAINPNGSRNTYPVIQGGSNSTSFILGSSYAMGPWIVGANALFVNRQGANWQDLTGGTAAKVGKMHEWGLDVGGTYAWGPGAAASLSYYYGERQQNGVDIRDGSAAASAVGNHTHAQGLILTQFFTW